MVKRPANPCVMAEEAASQHLKIHIRSIRKQLEGVRQEDADGIHDMRVASRRLRVALSEHASLFAWTPVKKFRRRVRKLTRILGLPRELDTTLAFLEARRNRLHGPARRGLAYVVGKLRTRRGSEFPSIGKALSLIESPKFDKTLMELFETLKPGSQCYLENAARSLLSQYTRLLARYAVWTRTRTETTLHQVRIRLKKIRYTCELYQTLYGASMDGFLQILKDAQLALGDWNDCRVALGYAEEISREAPIKTRQGISLLRSILRRQMRDRLRCFETHAQLLFSSDRPAEIRAFLRSPELPCCNPEVGRAPKPTSQSSTR